MAHSLKLDSDFNFEGVKSDERTPYFFPEPITGFMNSNYNFPAIYRWVANCNAGSSVVQMYIGETGRLCPSRLQGYLTPGPSQKTNIRMNETLKKLMDEGFTIGLDYLVVENLTVNGVVLHQRDLEDKYLRKSLENLLVFQARAVGNHVLNH